MNLRDILKGEKLNIKSKDVNYYINAPRTNVKSQGFNKVC